MWPTGGIENARGGDATILRTVATLETALPGELIRHADLTNYDDPGVEPVNDTQKWEERVAHPSASLNQLTLFLPTSFLGVWTAATSEMGVDG